MPQHCSRLNAASSGSDQRTGPPAAIAISCVRQARSSKTAYITAVAASGPTVTAPWLGIKIADAPPSCLAKARPRCRVATNAPVLAVFKRGRQTVSRPRAELMRP